MVANTNVRGRNANDPIKFTKSPTKGKAAAANVFNPNSSDRIHNLRLMFSAEKGFASN